MSSSQAGPAGLVSPEPCQRGERGRRTTDSLPALEEHQRLQGQPRRQPGKSGGGAVLGQSQAKPKPSRPRQPGFRRASGAGSNQRQEVGRVPIVLASTRSTLPEIVLHQQVKTLQKPSSALGATSVPSLGCAPCLSPKIRGHEQQAGTAIPKCLSGAFLGSKRKLAKLALVLGKEEGSFWDWRPTCFPSSNQHPVLATTAPLQEKSHTRRGRHSMISIRRGLGSPRTLRSS